MGWHFKALRTVSVKRKNSTFGNILINLYILSHTLEGRQPTTCLPPDCC